MGYEPRIVGIQLTETGQQQNFFHRNWSQKLDHIAGYGSNFVLWLKRVETVNT